MASRRLDHLRRLEGQGGILWINRARPRNPGKIRSDPNRTNRRRVPLELRTLVEQTVGRFDMIDVIDVGQAGEPRKHQLTPFVPEYRINAAVGPDNLLDPAPKGARNRFHLTELFGRQTRFNRNNHRPEISLSAHRVKAPCIRNLRKSIFDHD